MTWLAVLAALAGQARAQVDTLVFASEHVPAGLSAANPRPSGWVLEVQGQTVPGLRAPTGFATIPVLPRLGVGLASTAGGTRYTVGLDAAGIFSSDGGDRGLAASVSGGISWASPGRRVWLGPEASVNLLRLRSLDDRYRRISTTIQLGSGFSLSRRLSVLFRMGAALGALRSENERRGVRREGQFEPRFGVGFAARPTRRWCTALVARLGVRELIPRVPLSLVLSTSYRLGGPAGAHPRSKPR